MPSREERSEGKGRSVGMQNEKKLLTEVSEWARGLAELHACIAKRFDRKEPREHALAYFKGLLGPIERKNGWQIAEWVGGI